MLNTHQPIQQSLQKFRYMFTLAGMRLHEKHAPEMSLIKYRAIFLFNFIWYTLDVFGSLSYLCIGIFKGISLLELSFVAPCLIYASLGIIKAVTYTLYDNEAYQLIEDLKKLDASRKLYSNLDEAKEIKATESTFLNKVLSIMNVASVLVIVIYNLGPLIGTAVTYYRTAELKLFLPFQDVYPFKFNALDFPYWPFVYLHQSWSVALVVFYVGGVDFFLFTCCSYIRIQFRLIQLDIQNIIPDQDVKNGQLKNDVHFQRKFKDLIFRHQEVIRLAGALRKIYSISIFFYMITSSFTICLNGFNFTVMREIALILPSLIFLVTTLVQLLCLCYFGDLLMSSSEDVSEAVYLSRWYLADKNIAKMLLIVMTRAQVPCNLTASGFMEVSLRAYMKILSTAWSYFTLLQTMYNE